jgi:hypothetical protein
MLEQIHVVAAHELRLFDALLALAPLQLGQVHARRRLEGGGGQEGRRACEDGQAKPVGQSCHAVHPFDDYSPMPMTM